MAMHSFDPNLAAKVGSNVRRLRELAGWSRIGLAERAGVSRKVVGQCELGRVVPSLQTARSLAAALAVPIEAFFEEPRRA